MLRSAFLTLLAAAGLAVAATPAAAQITQIDPNSADQYQVPAEDPYADPFVDPYAADTAATVDEGQYQPVDPGAQDEQVAQAAPAIVAKPGQTVPREDIFSAAEGVFGQGAEGLAGDVGEWLKPAVC